VVERQHRQHRRLKDLARGGAQSGRETLRRFHASYAGGAVKHESQSPLVGDNDGCQMRPKKRRERPELYFTVGSQFAGEESQDAASEKEPFAHSDRFLIEYDLQVRPSLE